jgi:hypothetical protein
VTSTPDPSTSPHSGAPSRRHERLANICLLAVFLCMIAYAWATDYIGIAGERTIYTILCSGSIWSDSTCTGKVVLCEHYRFRALKVHREVLYWKVGATEPAGKPTKCEVMNGRNWSCPGNDEASRAVALQMVRGEVVQVSGSPPETMTSRTVVVRAM